MPNWKALGKHLYDIDGDILVLRAQDELSDRDVDKLTQLQSEIYGKHGRFFCLALSENWMKLDADARRRIGQYNTTHPPPDGVAFIGAGMFLRTVMTLIVRGIRMITKRPLPLAFFDTEAAARVWIAERREQLRTRCETSLPTP